MADNFLNLFSQLAPLLQSGQGQQLMGNLMSMMQQGGSGNSSAPTYAPAQNSSNEPFAPPFGEGGSAAESANASFDISPPDTGFSDGGSSSFGSSPLSTGATNPMDNAMEHFVHMKNVYDRVMNEPDSRINLLMALKPYMGESRLGSLERVVWIMKLTKFSRQILPQRRG